MLNLEHPQNFHMLCESLLWPLNMFYEYDQRDLPQLTPLFPQHIPEPYKELLAHTNNMTPTLENWHNGNIFIERLNVITSGDQITREVILRMDHNEKPVEYGASRIFLHTLPRQARELIQESTEPLGNILLNCHCRHTVENAGFFKIKPTSFLHDIFGLTTENNLYGRRNTLVSVDDIPIAEVCEILPPENMNLN